LGLAAKQIRCNAGGQESEALLDVEFSGPGHQDQLVECDGADLRERHRHQQTAKVSFLPKRAGDHRIVENEPERDGDAGCQNDGSLLQPELSK
jgi:hypothetical protein